MNNPLVSIIVPVYNVEKYLKKCIQSIINQTYKNLEIILVDDGSSDNSGKICDEFAQKDNRIKVIHKTNGGLSDARNAGLDVMSGEWVSFIDSDDFVSPYYIENLYYLAFLNGSDIAINSYKRFKDKSEDFIFKKITDEDILVYDSRQAIENMLYVKNFTVSAACKIFKKKLFFETRFPKGKIYEDLYTIPLVISKTDKVVFCDIKDYFYLQRDDSITEEIKEENFMIFDVISKLESKFDDKDIKNALLYHKAISSLVFLKHSLFLNGGNDISKKLKNNITSNIKTILFNKKFPIKVKIASLILCVFGTKTYLLTYSFFNLVKNKLK